MESDDNMEIESQKSGQGLLSLLQNSSSSQLGSESDFELPEQHRPTNDDFEEGESDDTESQDEFQDDFIEDEEDDFEPYLEEEEVEEEDEDFVEQKEGEMESESEEETPRYSVPLRNIDDGYCEVCYSSVTAKFLQTECQHLFDLISCKSCGIKVHHICHGMSTPVEETTDELGNNVKYFLCDSCKQTSNDKEKKCFICNNHEGCLRLSRDKKFIHPLCTIGSPSIAFRDVTTMDIDLSSFRKRGTTIPSINKCRICKNKIETHPCVNEKSNKHCHLHCALRFKLLRPRKNIWKIWFSLLPEDLKFTNLVSEEAVLGNIEDVTVKLKKVIGKTGMDTTLRFPMEIKQRRKGSRYRKKVGKDRTEASIFLQELFDKAKKTTIIDFEEGDYQKYLEDKTTINQTIGGKFVVIATDELTLEEQEMLDDQEEEEYDEQILLQIEDLNPYDSISELIKNFYKEIENANSLLEVYSDEKIPKLKKNLQEFPLRQRLSFPELLFFINVFQRRVQAALNHLCDLKDLQKLIASASIFPFSLTSMIQLLNKKYYTAVAADHLLAPYVGHCEPKSAYDAAQKNFNGKIVASNEKAIQQAFQIRNIYTHKPCKSITQQFKDLQDSYKQLVFLKEFHSELAGYFNSNVSVFLPQQGLPVIPLSKLLSLYAKANRLKLDEHFEEYQLLKQLIGESTDLIGLEGAQEFGETDLRVSGRPSPRGTPKVAEIIPVSAIPLGSHRRGRPPREDKLADKIKKDYQIQLERVEAFQNIDDLENDLINARENDDQDQIQHLEASLAKARDWQDKFRQSIQNNDATLGSLIERIDSIKVYFREMGEALRLRRDWSLWRLKVVAISRRLNKKRQKYLGEIDEMVDLEELEKVINMEQDIIHLEPSDEAFREIKDRFYQAQQIHLQLLNEEKSFSFAELKDFKKSLKELNIHIPESHSLQRRLIANENLQRLIETPLSLKKLEEKLTYIKDTAATPKDLDSELLQKITDKISEGKDLKLRAQEILSHAPYFSIQELKRMARLLKIHEEFNIETEETDKIQKYLSEFLKLLRAYSIITNGTLVDLRKLESEEDTEIINETVESIIQTCQTALNENLDNIDEAKAEKLDELFRWFHPELIENSKLKDFFDFLAIKLWKAKARIYLQTNYPRTLSTIQKFIAEIPHIEQLTREDYTSVKNIQHVIKRINKWKEDASEIIQSYSKEKVLDLTETSQLNQLGTENVKERLELINSKAKNGLLTHDKDFSMYSDLADQRDQLRKIAGSIDWIIFALAMKKQLEEDKLTLTYEIVKKAFEDLEKLELPQNRGICKLIVAWHALAESLKKTFEEGYEKKRVQVAKIDVEGEDIQKLINKNKNKLKIEEAHQMIQNLENGTKVVSLYAEAEIIKRDINELKIWASSIKMTDDQVSNYFDNFDQKGFNKLNFEFDDLNFRREINRLKVDMLNLPIRDENCEKNLQLLDFKYEAFIIANNLKKDVTLDEWRKVLKKGEKLNKTLENNYQLEKILASLKDEIEVAERLKAFASKLKNPETQETFYFEEVETALEEFNHCKIQLADDQKTLEDPLHAARTLQQKVHDLLEFEGTSIPEFNVVLSSLKGQRIDLSFEQELLKNAIKQAEEIDRAQRRGVEWKALTEVQQENFIKDCNQITDKVTRANNPYGNNVPLAQIKLKIHQGNQLRKEFPEDERLETVVHALQDIQTRVEQELREIFQIKDLRRLENYSFKTNNVLELIIARSKRKSALKPEKTQEPAGPRRRGRPSKDQTEVPKTQEKIVRPPFKPENEIIRHIQTIIEQSRFLKINEKDALLYAKKVFYALPELLHSKEKCKKILQRLRILLELRHIANSILEKEFGDQIIRGFMKERLSSVRLIEQDLKQKSNDQEKGKISKPETPLKQTYLYSPEKIQKKIPGHQLRHDRDFNNRQPMTPIPKNSILKIFSGALEWGEINSNPRVNLYTCSDLNVVITIPSLQANSDNSIISITNVIPWSNFQAYFSETLKKWERGEKGSDVQIIAGWVEPELSIYQNGLQRISQEFNQNEQVGVFKYNPSSTLIVLDREQMKRKWSDRLDFRVKKVRHNSEPALYFIIVHKPYKLAEAVESLAPELVEGIDEEAGKESSRKSQLFESAPNTGQHSLAASSLIEDETDYGVITGEEYFGQPFPSSFFSNEQSGQGEIFASPAFSGSRSQLEKRSYGRIETRDEEIDHIEQLVKKIKSGLASNNKDAVIGQLGTMQEAEVNEVAQHLDQPSRNQIVEILREMYQVSETQNAEPTTQIEEEPAQIVEEPPHHHHHKEILNEGEVEIESESPEPEHTQVIETFIIETTTVQVQGPTATQEAAPALQLQEEAEEPNNPPENLEDKEGFDDIFSS